MPAKLARGVRMLSTGHGRKTGRADALPAGIAAHTATRLNTAVAGEATAALRALTRTPRRPDPCPENSRAGYASR